MKKVLVFFLLLSLVLAAAGTVQAAVFGVTSRADLAGDDNVEWGPAYGYISPGTVFDSASGSTSVTVRAATPGFTPTSNDQLWGYAFWIFKQSNLWPTNFGPGDNVLGLANERAGDFGPTVLDFNPPVYGAGAQVFAWPAGFYVTVEALDVAGNSLGFFTFNNMVAKWPSPPDNTASFVGVMSDLPNISRLIIAESGSRAWISINQLDLITAGPPEIPQNTIASGPNTANYNLCETFFEMKFPEDISIGSVTTDGYGAWIYLSPVGSLYIPSGSIPMEFTLDGQADDISALEGVSLKQISAEELSCST